MLWAVAFELSVAILVCLPIQLSSLLGAFRITQQRYTIADGSQQGPVHVVLWALDMKWGLLVCSILEPVFNHPVFTGQNVV